MLITIFAVIKITNITVFLSDIDYESDRTCFGKPQTAVTSLQPIHQTLFLSINGLEEESNKIIDNYIFLSH